MSLFKGIKLWDTVTSAYLGLKFRGGSPQICAQTYLQSLAEGNITGHTAWSKTGYNSAVDAAAPEDIWSYGGTYTWPTAEMQMEVVSDSARDQQQAITAFATSAGGAKTLVTVTANHGLTNSDKVTISGCATAAYNATHVIESVLNNTFVIPVAYVLTAGAGIARGPGVNEVTLFYLTSTFVEKSVDVTLGPVTAVATGAGAADIYRVNAFRSKTVGNSGKAVGNIILRHIADTPIYGQISAGYTRARSSFYTIPKDQTLYITTATFSSIGTTAGKDVIFTMRATYDDKALAIRAFFLPFIEVGVVDGAIHIEFTVPIRLPEGVDMIVSGLAGNNTSKCSSILRGWLE